MLDRYFLEPSTKQEVEVLTLAINKEYIEAKGEQNEVKSEVVAVNIFFTDLNTVVYRTTFSITAINFADFPLFYIHNSSMV